MSTIPGVHQSLERFGVTRNGIRTWLTARVLQTEPNLAPALLRVGLVLVIFPHGAQHLLGWFGGYGFAGTHAWMTGTLGIPSAFATLAILTEFFAPLALLLGIGGRLAALGIAGLITWRRSHTWRTDSS